MDRIRALLAHVDVIRLDHFRAFAAAWHVPVGAPTAETGEWVPGPGAKFFEAVYKEFGRLPFVAEDLGLITPDVLALRDQFEIPGTRVLQFAFDGNSRNIHLPDKFVPNTVVYTGTHDNTTTREWYDQLPRRERRCLWDLIGKTEGESRDVASELIRMAWSSRAALALAPFQDALNLGPEGRMNVPGRAEGNWDWRATRNMLSEHTFQWLKDLTKRSNRSRERQLPTLEVASGAGRMRSDLVSET
jgi:4-alpha-glucanotransferase